MHHEPHGGSTLTGPGSTHDVALDRLPEPASYSVTPYQSTHVQGDSPAPPDQPVVGGTGTPPHRLITANTDTPTTSKTSK